MASIQEQWIRVPVSEALIWRAIDHQASKDENTPLQYEVFHSKDAWMGYLCEFAVEEWLGNLATFDQPINRADQYDFLFNGLKGDVKGSLLLNRQQYKKKIWIDLYLFCEYNPRENCVYIKGWLPRYEINTHRLKRRNMHSPAYIIGIEDLHAPAELLVTELTLHA
jgi:hypothetical protein